jgi:hypothetical protein
MEREREGEMVVYRVLNRSRHYLDLQIEEIIKLVPNHQFTSGGKKTPGKLKNYIRCVSVG